MNLISNSAENVMEFLQKYLNTKDAMEKRIVKHILLSFAEEIRRTVTKSMQLSESMEISRFRHYRSKAAVHYFEILKERAKNK